MLAVLAGTADEVRGGGPGTAPADLVELIGQLDLGAMDDATFASLLPAAGWDPAPTGTPSMAAINNLLNALPPADREVIIKRFISVLYSPHLG